MLAILRYFHASSEVVIATQAQKPDCVADRAVFIALTLQ
jgi:hypothetical protein